MAYFNASLRQLQAALGGRPVCDSCVTDLSSRLLLLLPVPQADFGFILRSRPSVPVRAVQYCLCPLMLRLRRQNHRRQRRHRQRPLVSSPALRMCQLRREPAVRPGLLFQRRARIRIIRHKASSDVWFMSCSCIRSRLLQLLEAAGGPTCCC
jgi:hypothetical protein